MAIYCHSWHLGGYEWWVSNQQPKYMVVGPYTPVSTPSPEA